MQLQHLTVDNFLRLNLIDLDLTGATAHLFAAENDQGKSSLQRAIRFALLGEVFGITKKSEYKKMIHEGAKDGTVRVTLGGCDWARDVKTAELHDECQELPDALQYCLNPNLFGKIKPAERRTFLFRLTGTSLKSDDIKRRAVIKGADGDLFDMVLPMLRSGFDAAHKEAQARATKARAQWTGLTGQMRYGNKIAETWTPVPPENHDPEKLMALEIDVDERSKVIARRNIEKGGLAAKLDDARRILDGQESTGEFDAKELKRLEKEITKNEFEAVKLREKRDGLNTQIASAVEKAPVTCIHCGEQMRVSFENVPGQGSTAIVTPYAPLPEDTLSKLRGELMTTSESLSKLSDEHSDLIAKAEAQRALRDTAKDGQPTVTQDHIDGLNRQLTEIDAVLRELESKQAEADLELRELRAAATLVENAAETKKRAYELHQAVGKWEKVVEVLAPDGIAAEILGEALKPINDRLRQTSITTGWDQVSISPELEMLTAGRPYSLLGESARWRADVAVTEAVAYLSNIRLMVVDRVDVLSPANRNAFLRWIAGLIPEYETILLFATLKAKPAKLPAGMVAHWMESGELKEADQDTAAA